jgi:carbonic anhydrase/acetyltransferase-like protein (isoleucine patch superfamily)
MSIADERMCVPRTARSDTVPRSYRIVPGEFMPSFSFEGRSPQVHPNAWVAPTAVLIGDVTLEADASVWFGAVLRADFGPIVVRQGANIQDNSVVHTGPELCEIGANATIGHQCVIHGCVIGAGALIGNGAIVLDGARVGAGTLVAAGATVSPDTELPEGVIAVGTPARTRGELTELQHDRVAQNGPGYVDLVGRYRAALKPID